MAVISGDGVFSHVFLGAVDTAVSAKFYDAALAALGIKTWGRSGMGGFCMAARNQRSSLRVLATVKCPQATVSPSVLRQRHPPKWMLFMPQVSPMEEPMKAHPAREAIYRALMPPISGIRQVTRYAVIPSRTAIDVRKRP